MKKLVTEGGLLLCLLTLTGCCGTIAGDFLLSSCGDPRRHRGEFVGNSSDQNGNRCETYELRDKTYKTICDRSGPSSTHPSAEPYPNN